MGLVAARPQGVAGAKTPSHAVGFASARRLVARSLPGADRCGGLVDEGGHPSSSKPNTTPSRCTSRSPPRPSQAGPPRSGRCPAPHLHHRLRLRVRRPQRLQPRLQRCLSSQPQRAAQRDNQHGRTLAFKSGSLVTTAGGLVAVTGVIAAQIPKKQIKSLSVTRIAL